MDENDLATVTTEELFDEIKRRNVAFVCAFIRREDNARQDYVSCSNGSKIEIVGMTAVLHRDALRRMK